MTDSGVTEPDTISFSTRRRETEVPFAPIETEAQELADRMPDLLVEAMRISMTDRARHSWAPPGRARARRSGSFVSMRARIPPTLSIGADRRVPIISMCVSANGKPPTHSGFGRTCHRRWPSGVISLSNQSKRDRALVMLLAAAELLVRSGERVALLGSDETNGQPSCRIHDWRKRLWRNNPRRYSRPGLPPRRSTVALFRSYPDRRFPRSGGGRQRTLVGAGGERV